MDVTASTLRRTETSFFFMDALGLHCCSRAFSSCSEQGLPFVTVQASRCSGFRCRAQALDTQAPQLWCTGLAALRYDLPRPGVEPVSPPLAGRFLATGLLGKSPNRSFQWGHPLCSTLYQEPMGYPGISPLTWVPKSEPK